MTTSQSGLLLPPVDSSGWGDDYNVGVQTHELHRIHRSLNADAHSLHYYLDCIEGDDNFEDGVRGWDSTRAAATVAQMLIDVADFNGARVVVHVAGGVSTKISTMLANPSAYHIYTMGAIQLPKNLAILGPGADVRSDAACALFLDDGTSSAEFKALVKLGRYGYVEDLAVCNRRPGGEGYGQSEQSVGSVLHNAHAWGCQMSGTVSESNSNDYAARIRMKVYKCGGYGHEARDTNSVDCPNQQYEDGCDYTQNALGQIHLMANRTNDLTSGNGYFAKGVRLHGGPGLNGYAHIEGWHNVRIDETYTEGDPQASPDTELYLVGSARAINGPIWVASRAYKVGDIVRGTDTSGQGSRLYFQCTVAGTAGSTEPEWMRFAVCGGNGTTVNLVAGPDFTTSDVGKKIAVTQGFVTTIASRVSATQITVADTIPGGSFTSEACIFSKALLIGDTITDGGATWKRIRQGAPRARANVTAYSLGQVIYPTGLPGGTTTKVYACTTAGTSHTAQPGAYGTDATGPITDGTAAFTAIGKANAYMARKITMGHNDFHGSAIAAASTAGTARLLAVDWCKVFQYRSDNDYRGSAAPDSTNPMATFGLFAWAYDVYASFRTDSAGIPFSAQDQVLLEAVPGRGRGEWFDGTAWQPINAGAGDVGTDGIWAALGDLAVGTGVGTADILSVGTDGQVPVADSGAPQGISWQDQAAAGTGDVATDTLWDALGDLAMGTGADTAAVLAVGPDGTGLVADSGETTGARWGLLPQVRTITDIVGGDVVVYSATGQLVASDPDPGTAISLALAEGPGAHYVRQGVYQLAHDSPIVGQSGTMLVLEHAAAQPDSPTLYGGTIIKAPASADMDGGTLIDGRDCNGFVVVGGAADCNAHSDYGAVFAGFRSGWVDPIVVKQKVAGILYTENASAAHDAYADMFALGRGYMYGNGAVYGILVDDSGGTNSQPTDGTISGDIRFYNCLNGGVRVTKGGWYVGGGGLRVVGTSAATGGIYMAGGTLGDVTVDSVGNGPSVELDGSAMQVGKIKILLAGSGSEVGLVVVTSGNVLDIDSIMVNDPAAGSFTFDYILYFAATPTGRTIKWGKLTYKAQAPNTAACNYMSNLGSGDTKYEVGYSGGHS